MEGHTEDIARRWEGRLLACSCGYRTYDRLEMKQHILEPRRYPVATDPWRCPDCKNYRPPRYVARGLCPTCNPYALSA